VKINKCIHCEIEFVAKENDNYFCSTNCYEDYTGRKSTLYENTCASCNQLFKGSKNSLYCSKSCKSSATKLLSREDILEQKGICVNEECKKEFSRKTRKHIFCSEACRLSHVNKDLEITVETSDGTYKLIAAEKKEETKLWLLPVF